MKLLAVHPSGLMYTHVFLRLEPLGLELVAAAARGAGHEVRIIDLQVETHRDYFRLLERWRPDAVCFSGQLPGQRARDRRPRQGDEGPPARLLRLRRRAQRLLRRAARARARRGRDRLRAAGRGRGVRSGAARGRARRRRDRARAGRRHPERAGTRRRASSRASTRCARPATCSGTGGKYFIGTLDPCASVEFARGCPWDCTFCSAWTFYGRSYRTASPEVVADELARIREPGIFIVDDVAFVHGRHGMAIGEALARRGMRKKYYLETRGDVLLRNKEVFRFWRDLGLRYMFIGLEAIDEEGLARYRKRVSLDKNFEALEFARSLGVTVAINIIADPAWDRARFEVVRQWCLEVPEVVNISVNTPYPGTETWHREAPRLTSRDYRLFDIQHAVLPTALAAAGVLRRAGEDPAGAEPQAPGLGGASGHRRHRRPAIDAGADELPAHAVEVQQRLRPRPAARRPRAAGPLRAAAPARSSRHQGQPARPLRARRGRPAGAGHRRRDGGLRRGDPDGGRLRAGCDAAGGPV